MAFPIPPGPGTPIPNNPFYSAPTNRLSGGDVGLVNIGEGLAISPEGFLNVIGLPGTSVQTLNTGVGLAVNYTTGNIIITNTGVVSLTAGPGIGITGGSNGAFTITNTLPATPTAGTVTQVNTGVGLTGGPITGTGTISLSDTGVAAATYTNPTITVDAQGRITFAAPGSPGSLVSGTYPIQVFGGTLISIADASTGNPGAVQLENSTASTSLTKAATANSVKVAYDAAQAASSSSASALALANSAQATANTAQVTANNALSVANSALPQSGGTMTGFITFAAGQTFPGSTPPDATTTSKGIVQVGANVQVSSGVISVLGASTTQAGVVQLNDSTNSTSTTQALTANAGNSLQQQINALAISSNITLAGTIDASTGLMVTVTTEGAANGFVVGSPLPTAAPANDNYFAIVQVAGTMTPPGGSAQFCHVGDWWLSNSGTWQFLDIAAPPPVVPSATPTVEGTVLGLTDATTTYNTALGSSALNTTSTGIGNTALGAVAGTLLGAATGATYVGAGAGCSADTTDFAVGVGFQALGSLTTGCANVGIGCLAGVSLTTESGNVILGSHPGIVGCNDQLILASGTGTLRAILNECGALSFDNISYGTTGQALLSNGTTSAPTWTTLPSAGPATPTVGGTVYACTTDLTREDTAIGYNALGCAGSLSGFNTAVGSNAMAAMLDGGVNVAVGQGALRSSVSDVYNVAVGYDSQSCLNGGSANTAVGTGSLCNNLTGNQNVSIGSGSMAFPQTGSGNVAVGVNVLTAGTTGDDNVAIGRVAMRNIDGSCNVALGYNSACNLTTGSRNVAIGPDTEFSPAAGSCRLAIGFSATDYWLTGDCTKAIKPGAGIIDCAGSCGTAGQVLMSNGSNAVCWGTAGGGSSPATPSALGTLFGCSLNTGSLTTALGCGALGFLSTGNNNVAVGASAGANITTGNGNTAVGTQAGFVFGGGNYNVAVGIYAAYQSSGSNIVAVGQSSATRAGSGTVAIGAAALTQACSTSVDNVAVGGNAGFCITTGNRNVLLGCNAGTGLTTGNNNVAIGPGVNLPTNTGDCQLAIGWASGSYWLTGCSNGNIDPAAGIIDCTGSAGTAGQALLSTGANQVCWGSPSVSVPNATPSAPGAVYGCTTTGAVSIGCGTQLNGISTNSVAIGLNALRVVTSSTPQNIAIGLWAGCQITSGYANTIVGSQGAKNLTTGRGNIVLGSMSFGLSYLPVYDLTTECNRVVVGSTCVTNAYIQVAWTAVSDARDKTNVTALPVGLDFVNKLNPVSFQFSESRECQVPHGPVRYGFLAQEVLEAEGENPVIIDTEDPEKLKMTHDYMNAVLVKAIQELSAKVDALEAKLAANG